MVCEFKGDSMTGPRGQGILPGDTIHTSNTDISSQLFKEFITADPAKCYFIQSYFSGDYVARIYSINVLNPSVTFGFNNPDKTKYPVVTFLQEEIKAIFEVTKVEHKINAGTAALSSSLKQELKMLCLDVLNRINDMQIACRSVKEELADISNKAIGEAMLQKLYSMSEEGGLCQ